MKGFNMKLSKKSISLLSWLSSVHPSILIRKGSIQKTCSENKSPIAKIVIDEDFPLDFVIFDIKNLLKVIDLFNEPEIEFTGDMTNGYMTISEDTAKLRYKFSHPDLHENIPPVDDFKSANAKWYARFVLDENEIENILKVASVMNLDTISFTKDKIKLINSNNQNEQFDYFEINYQNDVKFEGDVPDEYYIRFKTSTFNLYKGSYNVEFFCDVQFTDSNNKIRKVTGSRFDKIEGDVTVWLGASSFSV